MSSNEAITVVVRCRPMNRKEKDEQRKPIIAIDSESRQVSIANPETPAEPPKTFTFDASYDENTQQRFFYEESCFSVIESTLEGFNSTIFAYGQTGCGKSFTMQGPSTTDENLRGVIPNSFLHIFQFVKSSKDIEFLIRCSYLELYNEEIRDLLGNPKAPQKCELKEDPNKGIYVKGMTDVVVESPEDLNRMFDKGLTNRTVASTLMNSESSRSHSIFTIVVEMNTKDAATGKDMLRVGKLNLVDLAGSERAKKTGAQDKTLKEGIKINLSLSVLGNVISALSEGAKHIPYRDSKLTRLLQDSLGGNTKTMMVAAISPADYNYDETLSTLRYANRTKNIKNKPKINEDPKDTMIREFKAEIERLKKLLMDQANATQILAQLAPNALTQPVAQQTVAQTHTHSQQAVGESEKREEVSLSVSASQASVSVSESERRTHASDEERVHAVSVSTEQEQEERAQAENGENVLLVDESQQTSVKIVDSLRERDTGVEPLSGSEKREELVAVVSTHISATQHTEEHSTPPASVHSVQIETNTASLTHADTDTSAAHTAQSLVSDSPQRESSLVDDGEDDYADAVFESTGEMQMSPVKVVQNIPKTPPQELLNNPALDEQLRNEVANRLHQLQHMLMSNHSETSLSPSVKQSLSPIKEVLGSTTGSIDDLAPQKTAQQIAEEEEEAALVYRERKLKAKKKKEERQQREMQRILEEKRQVEEELEELRQSAQNNNAPVNSVAANKDGELSDTYAKKVNKIKKKYDKKLQSMTEEMREMRDEFEYQRKQMLDNLLEQEKDLKLYELICKSILSERDLKRIIEKSRFDEDADEWIIPFLKKRPVDVGDVASSNSNNFGVSANNGSRASSANRNNSGGNVGMGGLGLLPDIHNNKLREKESDRFDQTTRFATSNIMLGNLKSTKGKGGSSSNLLNSTGSFGARKPVVPLLTLPGHLITASSLLQEENDPFPAQNGYNTNSHSHSSANVKGFVSSSLPPQRSARSARSESEHNAINTPSGIGFSEPLPDKRKRLPGLGTENTNNSSASLLEKERLAKNKIPKIPISANTSTLLQHNNNNNSRMPAIHSTTHNNTHPYAHSNAYAQDSSSNYDDDEDFVETAAPSSARNNGQKKKKRAKETQSSRSGREHPADNGGGSARGTGLPPIDLKNSTPRAGSLPPI